MTVEVSGIAGAQARVAQIQARLDALSGGRPSVANSASGQAAFEMAMSKASAASSVNADTPADALRSVSGALGAASSNLLITAAKKYLGVPYKWGGTDPAVGLDCSGFVQRAFKDIGINLPRIAADQARQGTRVDSLAQAKPGDLVAFGSPVDHIGIYLGDNKMIVAPHSGDVVKIQTVYRTPTAIRRVLPDAAVSAVAAAGLSRLPGYAGVGGGSTGTVSGSALANAPAQYRVLFEQAEQRYGVKAELLAAVAKAESGFNPSARSGAGAIGLMQIMPGTARSLGVDPRNPAQAVDGAARLLRDGLRTFGSTELALAAYNAGSGAVRRYGGVPPYAETRAYVRKIMADPGLGAV